MKIPVPQPDWSETLRCSYNYYIMGSTDEPPSQLVASDIWPRRDREAFYLYRRQSRTRVERSLAAVQRLKSPPATVLDVGGAQGAIALPLARRGYRVTLNDLRDEVFAFVDLIAEPNESHARVAGDMFRTDFGGTFDIVFAGEVIEHVAHPDRFLVRCRELVNPAGFVVITTPNGDWIRNSLRRFSDFTEGERTALEDGQFKPDADGHIFALRRDEIFRLSAAAGLRVVLIEYLTPSARLERQPMGRYLVQAPFVRRHLHSTVLFACTPDTRAA